MSTPYGIQALTGELSKLARAVEGDRNNTLNEVTLKLSKRVLAGHLDKLDTFQRIFAVARQIGLDDAEIRATMASAWSKANEDGPGSIPEPRPPISFDGLKRTPSSNPADSATSTPATEPEPPRYDHLFLPRSGLADLAPPEPLIDGVLDRRVLFSITGRGGTYKSFVVLNWLACLATGTPWLGHEVTRAKVLYVVGEGLHGLEARLVAWEAAHSTTIPDDMFHVRRAPINLHKADRLAEAVDLWDRVQREKYEVIVFDTLQRASAGADVNSASDAGRIVANMGELRQANPDASVGYVAHTGKAEELGTRGSSALEDDLDIVWRLSTDDDSECITARMAKRRDGPETQEIKLQARRVPGTESIVIERYAPLLGADEAKHPKWTLTVLGILAGKLAEDGLSQTRIMEAANMTSWKSMHATAEWLISHNLVKTVGGGTRMRLKITQEGHSTLAKLKLTSEDA